jgi:hypothetical protein
VSQSKQDQINGLIAYDLENTWKEDRIGISYQVFLRLVEREVGVWMVACSDCRRRRF